ncbi:MAG TPA: divalent-cation tolerance protein CutA [Solirubrobacteraceae bacterium]|jgi:periplasmic divalent cation tolerance protein|nr:divalent-cation tolerance protein CutA [Solirubrobacteraceae bacterium]
MTPVEAVVCLVTAPPADARSLARALVERGLVACANVIDGVMSVYRWQDAVQSDEESLLVLKTTRAALAELERALGELHPYDTFELVALEIAAGSAPYLDWIAGAVAPPR